jgi:effector-binding domain-containing protein
MSYNPQLKTQDARPALSIRGRVSYAQMCDFITQCFASLTAYLNALGQAPAGPGFAIYYSIDMNDLDIEIGFPTAVSLAGRDNIRSTQIPGGKQVECHYTGPYKAIEPAYKASMAFIEKEGLTIQGPSYEFYLNDSRTVPEEKLETLIMFPVG